MMKNFRMLLMAAIVMGGGLMCMNSCTSRAKTEASTSQVDSDSVKKAEIERHSNMLYDAMNRYLADSIGSQYAPGELCIPCLTVISWEQDKENPDSVSVLGDFWVFNYNVVGDTLKTVSGGSHPGKMILRLIDDLYEVISFDQVGDGSNFTPSAKRIFGDMYEAFQSINSDEDAREQARADFIVKYVKANKLSVKYYQDYGWPAKQLTVNSEQ